MGTSEAWGHGIKVGTRAWGVRALEVRGHGDMGAQSAYDQSESP